MFRQVASLMDPGYLDSLLQDENSCVNLIKHVYHLDLLPFHISDLRGSIKEYLQRRISKYERSLDGILLGYKNLRVISTTAPILFDAPHIHVNIEAEFYVFKPELGSMLKGIVNKRSSDHVGCLVHRLFNVSIPKPVGEQQWQGDAVRIGDEVTVEVTYLNLDLRLPYIRSSLISRKAVDSDSGVSMSEEIKLADLSADLPEEIPKKKSKKRKQKALESFESEEVENVVKKKKRKKDKNDKSQEDVVEEPPKKKKKKSKDSEEDSNLSVVNFSPIKHNKKSDSPERELNLNFVDFRQEEKRKKKHKKSKNDSTEIETEPGESLYPNEVLQSAEVNKSKKSKKSNKEDSLPNNIIEEMLTTFNIDSTLDLPEKQSKESKKTKKSKKIKSESEDPASANMFVEDLLNNYNVSGNEGEDFSHRTKKSKKKKEKHLDPVVEDMLINYSVSSSMDNEDKVQETLFKNRNKNDVLPTSFTEEQSSKKPSKTKKKRSETALDPTIEDVLHNYSIDSTDSVNTKSNKLKPSRTETDPVIEDMLLNYSIDNLAEEDENVPKSKKKKKDEKGESSLDSTIEAVVRTYSTSTLDENTDEEENSNQNIIKDNRTQETTKSKKKKKDEKLNSTIEAILHNYSANIEENPVEEDSVNLTITKNSSISEAKKSKKKKEDKKLDSTIEALLHNYSASAIEDSPVEKENLHKSIIKDTNSPNKSKKDTRISFMETPTIIEEKPYNSDDSRKSSNNKKTSYQDLLDSYLNSVSEVRKSIEEPPPITETQKVKKEMHRRQLSFEDSEPGEETKKVKQSKKKSDPVISDLLEKYSLNNIDSQTKDNPADKENVFSEDIIESSQPEEMVVEVPTDYIMSMQEIHKKPKSKTPKKEKTKKSDNTEISDLLNMYELNNATSTKNPIHSTPVEDPSQAIELQRKELLKKYLDMSGLNKDSVKVQKKKPHKKKETDPKEDDFELSLPQDSDLEDILKDFKTETNQGMKKKRNRSGGEEDLEHETKRFKSLM